MSDTSTPAANLPDFVAGKNYEVSIGTPVEYPAGSGNWLRPGQTVTMDGAVALTLKGHIRGAGLTGQT